MIDLIILKMNSGLGNLVLKKTDIRLHAKMIAEVIAALGGLEWLIKNQFGGIHHHAIALTSANENEVQSPS